MRLTKHIFTREKARAQTLHTACHCAERCSRQHESKTVILLWLPRFFTIRIVGNLRTPKPILDVTILHHPCTNISRSPPRTNDISLLPRLPKALANVNTGRIAHVGHRRYRTDRRSISASGMGHEASRLAAGRAQSKDRLIPSENTSPQPCDFPGTPPPFHLHVSVNVLSLSFPPVHLS